MQSLPSLDVERTKSKLEETVFLAVRVRRNCTVLLRGDNLLGKLY